MSDLKKTVSNFLKTADGLDLAHEKIEFLQFGLNPEGGIGSEFTLNSIAFSGFMKVLSEISDHVKQSKEASDDLSEKYRLYLKEQRNVKEPSKSLEQIREEARQARQKLIGSFAESLFITHTSPEEIGRLVCKYLKQNITEDEYESTRPPFAGEGPGIDAETEPGERAAAQ